MGSGGNNRGQRTNSTAERIKFPLKRRKNSAEKMPGEEGCPCGQGSVIESFSQAYLSNVSM